MVLLLCLLFRDKACVVVTTPLADLTPPPYSHPVLERRVCAGQALVKGAGACRARAGRPACLDPGSAWVRHSAPRIAGVLSQCLAHKLLHISCIDGQVPQDLCGRVQAPVHSKGVQTHTVGGSKGTVRCTSQDQRLWLCLLQTVSVARDRGTGCTRE